jgi:hypothetical protein
MEVDDRRALAVGSVTLSVPVFGFLLPLPSTSSSKGKGARKYRQADLTK